MPVAGPGPFLASEKDIWYNYCAKLVKLEAVWPSNPAILALSLPTPRKFPVWHQASGCRISWEAYQNSKWLRWVGKVGEKHYPMKGGFVFGKPRFGSATNGLTTQMNTIIEIISTSLHLAVHGRGQGNPRPHDLERSFRLLNYCRIQGLSTLLLPHIFPTTKIGILTIQTPGNRNLRKLKKLRKPMTFLINKTNLLRLLWVWAPNCLWGVELLLILVV